jgi:hypothetical protein
MGNIERWKSRWELEQQSQETLHLERLTAQVRALRLSRAYDLHRVQISMHIALAVEIAEKYRNATDPLVKVALQQAFTSWLQVSDAIVRGQ